MNNEVKSPDVENADSNRAVDADEAARPGTADYAHSPEEPACPNAQSEHTVTEDAPDTAGQTPEAASELIDPIEELKSRVASLEDNLLRAKADYQNLQRRSAQERSAAVRYANADLMRSLLDVVDDLQRSLEAADNCKGASSLVDGIRLVYENLMKALRAQGLEEISALQQQFDPHVHQAMLQQPSEDHPPGTVLEEISKGYRLRDRVLRPAKVVVSKAANMGEDEQPEQSANGSSDENGKKRKWKRSK